MAVNSLNLTSALVLKIKTGVDARGNDVFRSITLRKVKPAAVDQDVFDMAQGISSVLSSPIDQITRQNLNELVSM